MYIYTHMRTHVCIYIKQTYGQIWPHVAIIMFNLGMDKGLRKTPSELVLERREFGAVKGNRCPFFQCFHMFLVFLCEQTLRFSRFASCELGSRWPLFGTP